MRGFLRQIHPILLLASIAICGFAHADEPAKGDPEPAQIDNPAAPPSTDILDTLARTEKYTLFLKAVNAAGLEEELRKVGPMTVFAPTDEAFRKLPMATLDELLADKARMTVILQGHILAGRMSSKQLAAAKSAKTLSQSSLKVTPASGDMPLKIEHANVVTSDLATTNGVVHAIDVVLMPK